MSKYTQGEIEGQSQILNITFGYMYHELEMSTEEVKKYIDYVHNKLEEYEE